MQLHQPSELHFTQLELHKHLRWRFDSTDMLQLLKICLEINYWIKSYLMMISIIEFNHKSKGTKPYKSWDSNDLWVCSSLNRILNTFHLLIYTSSFCKLSSMNMITLNSNFIAYQLLGMMKYYSSCAYFPIAHSIKIYLILSLTLSLIFSFVLFYPGYINIKYKRKIFSLKIFNNEFSNVNIYVLWLHSNYQSKVKKR